MAVDVNFHASKFPSKLYSTWEPFEEHFRAACQINGWDDHAALSVFPFCLTGFALDEYQQVPIHLRQDVVRHPNATIEGLLTALRNRLGNIPTKG